MNRVLSGRAIIAIAAVPLLVVVVKLLVLRILGWSIPGSNLGTTILSGGIAAAVVGLISVLVAQYLTGRWHSQALEHEAELEAQRAHEAALQKYFEQVGTLLVEQPVNQWGEVVRAQTLIMLEGLDPKRKRILLQFLHESDLINCGEPVVGLSGANLSEAELSTAILGGAHLGFLNLKGADLRGANLYQAYLGASDLSGAQLSGAHLSEADLIGADLSGAKLRGADLRGADLPGTDLRGADLRGADLREADLLADLRGANLRGADLRGAKMTGGTDLRGADLREALVTKQQIDRIRVDETTRLPNHLQPPAS